MLTWMNLPQSTVGLDHGILRAQDVQRLMTLEEAGRHVAEQGRQVLAEAREEAQALLAQARQQAGQLLADAQADIEAARQQGYQDGHREAVQHWHDERMRQAQDRQDALRATHERLAEIVTTAVERIVQSEDRGTLYQRALKNVQTLTRGASSLTLRVSPADHDHARSGLGVLGPPGDTGLPVELRVDPSLKPGSCIFESELGVLDASLQVQLEGLRGAMERAVRRALADNAAEGGNTAGSAADGEDESTNHGTNHSTGHATGDTTEPAAWT